ncbi:RelA/SpoT domain-containing protein [Modestobacter sp. VKM Ac-2978]|uniref:RelA/SpoT domain-containing protein n=1 Tax=Modestobacter sp. VKM Ac-2978 TaxID=3004132 RepID=UPI0022AA0154|nr:RelA/SpoT domain-containing protein [Modestobacter sp. VKM Ac-2978]MCZ2850006.1 RelA/SpoT domain-containing protein [Modestobacter sp. VKM Ac-2978]
MPSAVIALPSKTKINKCGALLQQHVDPVSGRVRAPRTDEALEAVEVVNLFRSAHSYPLTKVQMGVRSMMRTLECELPPTQRLKRFDRIVRKLSRMQNSSLARLQDVGGVRAVCSDPDEAKRVLTRLQSQWGEAIVKTTDYVANPQDTGYRAVHLIVRRDDRLIEVQIRTRRQQFWADAVESADSRRGLTLKDGTGPAEMMNYFALSGEVIYRQEYEVPLDEELVSRFQAARSAVVAAGYYRQ